MQILVSDWWNWTYFHANFRKFWKYDPCLYMYQFLLWIRGHCYTRRLILQPISAACPWIDLCTKNPPPSYNVHNFCTFNAALAFHMHPHLKHWQAQISGSKARTKPDLGWRLLLILIYYAGFMTERVLIHQNSLDNKMFIIMSSVNQFCERQYLCELACQEPTDRQQVSLSSLILEPELW